MRNKLERIDELIDAGFHVDEIGSDDDHLRVELTRGPTKITIRADRDEIAGHWPQLFARGRDVATIEPDLARSRTGERVPSDGLVRVQPYGLADVVTFFKMDRLARKRER